MKTLVEIKETPNEGLISLMGQRVTLFCLNYIYEGKLVGVNDDCCKLEDASIVYETGPLCGTCRKDAQLLPNPAYPMLQCIEMFTVLKG